jgi:EAL domain-containing protein (putative c-di-GMP-specific phosphodiesterase class I)
MAKSTTIRTVSRAMLAGNVEVVFQPIVDIRSGRLFAYEALARTSKFDGPVALFDAAVAQKQVGRLGRHLRELATASCPAHALFLNVHPVELAEHWLVQPDDPLFMHEPGVFLEITESVPLSHHALVHSVLSELRGKGVGIVVDDLGAGYSNLSYIADLHPQFVKVDRGLVTALHLDPRRQKLLAGMARLCTDLGAQVVAEGIETRDELLAARDAGVQFAQGYFVARPALPPPLPEISTWAQRKSPSSVMKRRKSRMR